ncbi:hypothetical protein [Novosphingobium sp. LASN5T]|uniref:hypothetical protein n=1 Tax=Novosphingobium sp. LASN5T TaxID=2491021 RepID=UPI000F5EE8A9|nr:hypothetical protein [Novosphingobium sp. LASN5T]RQW37684.1 hypothetical protein EH199_23330 [Novosphingobium sp. LASN5T]
MMRFNDNLLAAWGSYWHDWMPHDIRSAPPSIAEFVEQGRSLLRQEFGNASRLVLKDPRMCCVMPAWLDIFAAEAIEAKVVLPVRHPLAVAKSLAKRDAFDEISGMLLWLRHVLDAESATRGRSRAFVNYEDLLLDWRSAVDRIGRWTGLSWPSLSDSVADDVDAFLSTDLQHHAESDICALMPRWVRDVYVILRRWAREGESPAEYATIDAIAHAFRTSAENFLPAVTAITDLRGKLQREMAASAVAVAHGEALENERAAIALSLNQMTADRDQIHAENARLRQELAAERMRADDERAQRIEITAAHAALADRCESQASEIALLIANHAATSRSLNVELDRMRTEAAIARSKAAARTAKIDRQVRSIAGLSHQLREADAKADWLRRIGAAITEFPRWWALLPAAVARRKQDRRLRNDGLFDAARYREDHPDVADAGIAPLRHYLLHGIAERRKGPLRYDA